MNILRKERILSRVALRVTSCLVIAVRVSGGHLCEAEAPTEPAGETAARCVAIRFPLSKSYKQKKTACQAVSVCRITLNSKRDLGL